MLNPGKTLLTLNEKKMRFLPAVQHALASRESILFLLSSSFNKIDSPEEASHAVTVLTRLSTVRAIFPFGQSLR